MFDILSPVARAGADADSALDGAGDGAGTADGAGNGANADCVGCVYEGAEIDSGPGCVEEGAEMDGAANGADADSAGCVYEGAEMDDAGNRAGTDDAGNGAGDRAGADGAGDGVGTDGLLDGAETDGASDCVDVVDLAISCSSSSSSWRLRILTRSSCRFTCIGCMLRSRRMSIASRKSQLSFPTKKKKKKTHENIAEGA